MQRFYGWFDDAAQTVPSYDPPRDGPCPYCLEPLTTTDVRTHSIMIQDANDYAKRSYFFRTHRTCDDGAQARGKCLDDAIFVMIEANGD